MTAIRALMADLVDYAGLFPPAGLDMFSAVRRYRGYLTGEDHWALGKFVVPAARLTEFVAAFNDVCCGEREPVWSISVLASGDTRSDAAAMEELEQGAFSIDSLEMKAATTAQAKTHLSEAGNASRAFVEFAPGDAAAMLPVLARFGAHAKIRTGGVTAEAFPSVEAVAEFLAGCVREKVAFKATAGLHHAVRGSYPLTYETGSARATMHGFVNVFLAAVLAWRGENMRALVDTLREERASAFVFDEDSVRWPGFDAGLEEIEAVRREFAMSYGSCSFAEPMEEAKANGWL